MLLMSWLPALLGHIGHDIAYVDYEGLTFI